MSNLTFYGYIIPFILCLSFEIYYLIFDTAFNWKESLFFVLLSAIPVINLVLILIDICTLAE